MNCSTSHKEYKFFNGIEKYIKDAEKLDSHGDLTEFESSCNSASKYHHAIDSKIICQKFQYLYKLLSTKESSQTQSLDEKDYDFINFWLNYALKDFRSNDPGIVKKIFEDVLKNGTKVKTDSQLLNKICYINDDIYNNMDIVFTLYYNYDKIYKDNTVVCNDKESCEVYTKQCLEKYKQGIYQCPENDNVFCNKLHDLKNKYEERQDVRSPSGFKISEILMLPTYKDINPNGKSFRDKKNKKREIKDNINQEAHQMLYKSEENKINVNSKQYNILYNS
ncbi:hypothetical protein PVPAM_130015100 [Plasmodium vivax]|nr:hypothetical protein PVPAM_130015100 [Plasmodium vivax]